jgi:histidinol dehydrogenase
MFQDFFKQVSNQELSPEQYEAIANIITNISTHEGGLA